MHALPSDNYSLLNCFNTLNSWFLQNNLMINMSKTTLINFSRVNSIFPTVIDGQIISPTNSVKNLGFTFDSKLSFIDKISSVLHFLHDNICKILIESTVLSRIEYCNSVYHGLPLYSINCINRVIRSSVSLLFRI